MTNEGTAQAQVYVQSMTGIPGRWQISTRSGIFPVWTKGGREILLDDAIRLATAARATGADVRLELEPTLWHAWQLFAGLLPEAETALARAARFIGERMKPG